METHQDTPEAARQSSSRTARFLFALGLLLIVTMLIVPCVVIGTSALFDTGIALVFG